MTELLKGTFLISKWERERLQMVFLHETLQKRTKKIEVHL